MVILYCEEGRAVRKFDRSEILSRY